MNSYYKILKNDNRTNFEFEIIVNEWVKKLSEEYIVIKSTLKTNDHFHHTGAIIKYKERTNLGH